VEFNTAVARVGARDEAQVHTFTIIERDPDTEEIVNKVECHAYDPTEGQVIMMITEVMGRRANIADKIAGFIDFFTDVLDEESKDYVIHRLLDPNDTFGIEDVQPIVFWLMEEFGGRPTRQPSDYLPSRKAGGQRSTQRTSKSTSSRSRSTAS
jgi:hypothetical protein